MRTLKAWVVAMLVAMSTAHVADAQGIRGRVMAAGVDVPLAAAIVQARTADGTVVGSTLTSARGAFAIAELPDATYTLRVLRIGFKPFDSPPIVVAGGTSEPVVLDWIGDAIALTTQVITSGRTCKVSADSGTLISNVWTETRKALLSSILAERGDAPLIVRMNYARTAELKSELVREQRLTTEARRSFRAYTSWAPESLAANGYLSEGVIAGRPVMVYRAPDATTLMAESFAGTHCFSLSKGTGIHAGHLGLMFEPFDRKRNRVDIRGTFWIEQATSRLQRIEFSYVGLPSVANAAKSGGFVEFASLTTGQWLLSRWHIRMPHVAVQQVAGFGQAERLDAVDESGGIVLSVAQGDTTFYTRTLPLLTMRLGDAPFLSELSGSKVELVGTGLRATTNAQGRVVFRNMIPGRYAIRTVFPALAVFGNQEREQFISVDSANKADSIVMPDARSMLRTACGARAERSGSVALFGTVRDTSGLAADGGEGVVTAQANAAANPSSVASTGALVDRNGQFVICGTPRGELVVRAENGLGAAQRMTTVAPNALLHEVPLRVTAVSSADSASRMGPANIEFRVVDSEALPVPRIRITVVDVNGKQSSAITDNSGRALLLDQAVGRANISAGPGAVASPTLTAGRNLVSIVLPEPPS